MTSTTRLLAQHLQVSNCAYADMDADEDGFTIRGNWAAPGSASKAKSAGIKGHLPVIWWWHNPDNRPDSPVSRSR